MIGVKKKRHLIRLLYILIAKSSLEKLINIYPYRYFMLILLKSKQKCLQFIIYT